MVSDSNLAQLLDKDDPGVLTVDRRIMFTEDDEELRLVYSIPATDCHKPIRIPYTPPELRGEEPTYTALSAIAGHCIRDCLRKGPAYLVAAIERCIAWMHRDTRDQRREWRRRCDPAWLGETTFDEVMADRAKMIAAQQ